MTWSSKGEKVTAKAHGGLIDIQGVTVATVNEKVQLQSVRTWFDPLDMFRQIAPDGVVKKEAVDKNLSPDEALDSNQTAEINQKPRPLETALPDRTKEPAERTPTAAGGDSSRAEKLVEATGRPFAGTASREAVAPFLHPTGAEHVGSGRSSEDSQWSKVSHPNVDQSQSGAGTGAGCPFMPK